MLSLLSKEAYQFVAQKKEKTKKKRKEKKRKKTSLLDYRR
jgi:hypothetical protein